jgi:hypothetical protein
MGISRFDTVTVNIVTNGKDVYGGQTTTETPWFNARALVSDVKSGMTITKENRVYNDLSRLTFPYTPNMQQIAMNQESYSMTWRGQDWRINDAIEANNKMSITFMCYRNAPSVSV